MLRKPLTTFLALVIILSFCIPVHISYASSTFYNENIALYLIGKTALTRYNFTGTEIGFASLANLEQSFPDVSYYKLYVGQFKAWPTEYLYFSNLGQDLILSEYASSDGAFLYVTAGSIDSAQRFASELGNLTSLSFVPLATPHSDVFVFASPSTFSQVAPGFLQALIPTSVGGFSNLVSISKLVLENSPQITLIGKKAADGFIRSVIFDYLKTQALSGNPINIGQTIFSQSKINASTSSNQSQLIIISYGQVMGSSDVGEIERNLKNKSSKLTISVPSQGTLYFPNITISSNMPLVLTYREISQAVVNVNDEFEIQVRLRNVGTSSALNVKLTDDWWSKDGVFSLVAGNFSSQIDSLASGENYTISYRLKSAYSQTADYYISPLNVTYQWKIGDDTLQLSSLTNDLHLMTNQNSPSIYVVAQLSSYNTNFGSSNQVTIKAVNKGTLAAYNLNLGGQVLGTLPVGESWQIITQAQLSDMSSSLFKTYWVCSWSDGVQTRSSISNIITLSNMYDAMKIPSILLTKVASKIVSGDKMYINMTLAIQNVGGAEGLGITVRDTVPTGFRFINGTLSEKNGELTTLLENLKISETETFHYLLEVLDLSRNYIFIPASSYYDIAGVRFSQISTSDAVPLGFSLILHLSETEAFNTYNGTGYYIIRNEGDKDIYTMETQISNIPLLKVTGNTTSIKRFLASNSEYRVDFNYMFNGTDTNKQFYAQSNFFFAGKIRTVNSSVILVSSYSYPKITMSYNGDAIEGEPFEVKVTIINIANVTLNNIAFKVNLPSETKLIEGTDSFQISQLQSNEEKTFTLKISYSFPKDYTITSSKVSFDYKTQTMTSSPTTFEVTVSDNLMIRYIVPILLALVVMVIAVLFVGRTRKK